ncbi:serine racemase VanT catalytic subunit [Coprococcus sp. AF21-14LB]|uniref:serine racemase VanT catalytic subunit n=1 Tax=Coprococcus sp. AF21-14LB TaxID=2292231 RepID=UPI001FA8F4C6|nr:serine racemase VanT catalytic subunit [Coprococcus sp. AF21-14LB]
MRKETMKKDRAWIEVNLKQLQKNAEIIQKFLKEGCELMAVVKANGYGHGAVETAKALNAVGVCSFAVATIDEGIALRREGICGKILILGYTDPERAGELKKYELCQTIISLPYADALKRREQGLQTEVKIDTGMHRQGVRWDQLQDIKRLFLDPAFHICGMYTHFCAADSQEAQDMLFTKEQIRRFEEVVKYLRSEQIPLPSLHMQSSYGLVNYPELVCDYARIGILLYGSLSSGRDEVRVEIPVAPAMEIKARVTSVRKLEEGEQAGYGRAFQAERKTKLACISVGYADGLPRALSCGKGEVLVHGKRVPLVGRICMDQALIDVTEIEDVKEGDVVTLVGRDGKEEIQMSELADRADTIANELFSRLGSRLKRIYHF